VTCAPAPLTVTVTAANIATTVHYGGPCPIERAIPGAATVGSDGLAMVNGRRYVLPPEARRFVQAFDHWNGWRRFKLAASPRYASLPPQPATVAPFRFTMAPENGGAS